MKLEVYESYIDSFNKCFFIIFKFIGFLLLSAMVSIILLVISESISMAVFGSAVNSFYVFGGFLIPVSMIIYAIYGYTRIINRIINSSNKLNIDRDDIHLYKIKLRDWWIGYSYIITLDPNKNPKDETEYESWLSDNCSGFCCNAKKFSTRLDTTYIFSRKSDLVAFKLMFS